VLQWVFAEIRRGSTLRRHAPASRVTAPALGGEWRCAILEDPPIEDCKIGHFLPEGPQTSPSIHGNPMILGLRSDMPLCLLLGALVGAMASGALARGQVKTQESVGLELS